MKKQNLLDEEAVDECLNIDDAPVVLQLTDSETVDIVMHPDTGSNTADAAAAAAADDDNEVLNEQENISIDKCISLTEELIHGFEQNSFITQQHIMWVYKIQEVLQKRKALIYETVKFVRHV
jgi:hypothetical protein